MANKKALHFPSTSVKTGRVKHILLRKIRAAPQVWMPRWSLPLLTHCWLLWKASFLAVRRRFARWSEVNSSEVSKGLSSDPSRINGSLLLPQGWITAFLKLSLRMKVNIQAAMIKGTVCEMKEPNMWKHGNHTLEGKLIAASLWRGWNKCKQTIFKGWRGCYSLTLAYHVGSVTLFNSYTGQPKPPESQSGPLKGIGESKVFKWKNQSSMWEVLPYKIQFSKLDLTVKKSTNTF